MAGKVNVPERVRHKISGAKERDSNPRIYAVQEIRIDKYNLGVSDLFHEFGEVPEWPNGPDCKSGGASLRWFESTPHHHFCEAKVIQNEP